jgi:scyllo-inositol 2-dehydrogenase (NADP+)
MLRFGVIGTGFISDWFMDGISHCACAEVTAVCSRSSSRGETFAARHNIPFMFLSPSDMAASSCVDAFYIASPNGFHAEQALIAIKAGKHALVEKPAAPDLLSFNRMRNAAAKGGVVLLEAMRPAHMASREALRAQLACIGPIRRATLSYCQYSSRYDKFKKGIVENAFDPVLANCSLLDLGIYCVNLLIDLFGLPKAIQAVSQKLGNGFDAQGTILAEYPGMLAEIRYSKIADGRGDSEIQGERGSLLIDAIGNPKRVRVLYRDGIQEEVAFSLPEDQHGMTPEIRDFVAMAQTGVGQNKFLNLTANSLQITDRAREIAGIDFSVTASMTGESL